MINDFVQILRNKALDRDKQIEDNKNAYSRILREIREEIAKFELQKSLDSTDIIKKKEEIKRLNEKADSEKPKNCH